MGRMEMIASSLYFIRNAEVEIQNNIYDTWELSELISNDGAEKIEKVNINCLNIYPSRVICTVILQGN